MTTLSTPAPGALALLSLYVCRPATATDESDCSPKKMGAIFDNGKELCNTMWGDSFVYTPDANDSYTMWHFEAQNPNDKVTKGGLVDWQPIDDENCGLVDFQHKIKQGKENLGECHPFQENACCKSSIAESPETLNAIYEEDHFRWDRCGDLSPACERFFVQEVCMYECDPNVGYFRKYLETDYPDIPTGRVRYRKECNPRDERAYPEIKGTGEKSEKGLKYVEENCDGDEHNRWKIFKMPIKASYCNAWFDACKADIFCGKSFWSCDKTKEKKEPEVVTKVETNAGLTAAIVAVSVVAGLVFIGGIFVVYRECRGKPVFGEFETLPSEKHDNIGM